MGLGDMPVLAWKHAGANLHSYINIIRLVEFQPGRPSCIYKLVLSNGGVHPGSMSAKILLQIKVQESLP